MSDKYLNKLEADLSGLLDKTVSTYEALETKARYIATAFTALLASVMGYILQSFDKIDLWQQAFIIGLIPCFAISFLSLVSAMMGRKYRDGIRYPYQEGLTHEAYMQSKCEQLNTAISTNQDSNNKKGRAVNKAFVALSIAAPAAVVSSVIAAFYGIHRDGLGLNDFDLYFLLGLLLAISIASAISIRHFSILISGLEKDTSKDG